MTRHTIVCPAHVARASVRGDERFCPVGDGHRLMRWWVVDERREVVLCEVSEETGVEREINTPLRRCPRLAVEDVSMTEKESGMPRGVRGSGPYGDPTKAAAAPAKVSRGRSCLESSKLSAGGRVLWLRLVRSSVKDDDTRYRIRWELLDGKQSESGVALAFGDETDARREYQNAVNKARADGWVPSGWHLVLKPVPAPPAAAKGRKAA